MRHLITDVENAQNFDITSSTNLPSVTKDQLGQKGMTQPQTKSAKFANIVAATEIIKNGGGSQAAAEGAVGQFQTLPGAGSGGIGSS